MMEVMDLKLPITKIRILKKKIETHKFLLKCTKYRKDKKVIYQKVYHCRKRRKKKFAY